MFAAPWYLTFRLAGAAIRAGSKSCVFPLNFLNPSRYPSIMVLTLPGGERVRTFGCAYASKTYRAAVLIIGEYDGTGPGFMAARIGRGSGACVCPLQ
ncbi:unnamed protein product [Diplocarpon coronariae]|nr:hypothetical protein JHW43_005305 [Diplocarpon mali]